MSELIGYRFLTEASVLIFSMLGKALRVEVMAKSLFGFSF